MELSGDFHIGPQEFSDIIDLIDSLPMKFVLRERLWFVPEPCHCDSGLWDNQFNRTELRMARRKFNQSRSLTDFRIDAVPEFAAGGWVASRRCYHCALDLNSMRRRCRGCSHCTGHAIPTGFPTGSMSSGRSRITRSRLPRTATADGSSKIFRVSQGSTARS